MFEGCSVSSLSNLWTEIPFPVLYCKWKYNPLLGKRKKNGLWLRLFWFTGCTDTLCIAWVVSSISPKIVSQSWQICPFQESSSHSVFTFPVILEGGHLPALKAYGSFLSSFLYRPEFNCSTGDSLFLIKTRQVTVQENKFYIFSCFYSSQENTVIQVERDLLIHTLAQGRAAFNLIRSREVEIFSQKHSPECCWSFRPPQLLQNQRQGAVRRIATARLKVPLRKPLRGLLRQQHKYPCPLLQIGWSISGRLTTTKESLLWLWWFNCFKYLSGLERWRKTLLR